MKKQTNENIENIKKEVDEWKSKYLRALADYQNLERRTQEDKKQTRTFATEIILARLLPVVDTFAKAREHLKDTGLDLAFKELLAVLEEQGVERIDVLGKLFNPHEMECVEVISGEENKVIEEILPGYRFRGKILRVAQVKVGKDIKSEVRSTKLETSSNDQNIKS